MDNAGIPPPNPFARTRFLLSAARFAQLPDDTLPEAAFVGRSNSGKSSALNVLCGQKQLARVSKTPGRTQLVNLFGVPAPVLAAGEFGGRLVDLPGYGFADVPAAVRQGWAQLVGGYVERRSNLRGLVVLMDIRHPLTELDWQMLRWSGARGLPCHVLLTKDDKLGHGAAQAALLGVRAELRDAAGTSVQRFSALSRSGAEQLREVVAGWLELRPAA